MFGIIRSLNIQSQVVSTAPDSRFSSKKSSPRIPKMAASFPAPLYYPNQKVSVSDSITEINLVAISAIFAEFGE